MNRKCVYLTEGECEEKLIKALKENPALILPGKVKRFNVIQSELKTSNLVTFSPGSMVILVFDTDVDYTEHLKKNIELLKKRCAGVKVVTLAQVLNFEDEIRDYKFLQAKSYGYLPAYTRTQFTDDLHEAFGFRTDFEIIKKSQMNHILKLSKERKNITSKSSS